MIAHQAIAPEINAVASLAFSHQFDKLRELLRPMKKRLPVIATVDHMMQPSRQASPGQARHGPSLSSLPVSAKKLYLSRFFPFFTSLGAM